MIWLPEKVFRRWYDVLRSASWRGEHCVSGHALVRVVHEEQALLHWCLFGLMETGTDDLMVDASLIRALNDYIRDSLMRPKIADSGSSRKIINSKPKALSDSDFWAAGLGAREEQKSTRERGQLICIAAHVLPLLTVGIWQAWTGSCWRGCVNWTCRKRNKLARRATIHRSRTSAPLSSTHSHPVWRAGRRWQQEQEELE